MRHARDSRSLIFNNPNGGPMDTTYKTEANQSRRSSNAARIHRQRLGYSRVFWQY